MKQSFADILKRLDESIGKKIAAKMPEWSGTDGLEIPSSINFEQCSSTMAAEYKAGFLAGMRVADLTGGLGVDSWAFAGKACQVWYNEMDKALAGAVERNFERLGTDGVRFNSFVISPENRSLWLPALKDFNPDAIYLDPARRSSTGKKVFLLEDCSPNILELLPDLLGTAGVVMVKLSPMADLSMVTERITASCIVSSGRRCLREMTVIEIKGEVRELLCIIDANWDGTCTISAAELSGNAGRKFSFTKEEEERAIASFAERVTPGDILYVPSAAMLKAGAYKLPCSRYGMKKLSVSSHIYIAAQDTSATGKYFKVECVLPFSGSGMKEMGRRYPCADVTSRDLPVTSDELRARLKVRPGNGKTHIFACRVGDTKVLIAAIPAEG